MKKEADYFDGAEPHLIFVAKRLSDAIAPRNGLLTPRASITPSKRTSMKAALFSKSMRVGAFFYVRPEARDQPWR